MNCRYGLSEHMPVDSVDVPRLIQVDGDAEQVKRLAQTGGKQPQVTGPELPCDQCQGSHERDLHRKVEEKVRDAGHLHAAGALGSEVGRSLRGVANKTVVNDRIYKGDHARCRNRVAPAVFSAVDQRQRRQGHGCRGGAEVAPAPVDSLGETDFPCRKPLADHSDPDDETGADETEEKARQRERLEAVGHGVGKAQETRYRQHQ